MPEGPFGGKRPGARCKQTLVVRLNESYHVNEIQQAEIQARINEAERGDKQLTAIRAEVIQRNSSTVYPSAFIQILTDVSRLNKDAVEGIAEIVNGVLEDTVLERQPPKVKSWSIKAR